MLRPEDLELLKNKGISESEVEAQLERFKTGFPYLKICDAARVGAGIFRLSDEEVDAALDRWKEYLAHGGEVCKFVPASGAASRMFKALFEYVDGGTDELKEAFARSHSHRKYRQTSFRSRTQGSREETLRRRTRRSPCSRTQPRHYRCNREARKRMNYGGLPKGLLKFHKYAEAFTHTD